MEAEKTKLDLWVPKQVVDLWTMSDAYMEKYVGSIQYYLLEEMRSLLESIIMEVEFAEEYKSWDDYKAWLVKAGALNSGPIADIAIKGLRDEKDLEHGQKLLEKGIDSKKLNEAKTILEKCLEEV